MSEVPIPKKISPDPIIDSIVEFRFASSHQKDKLITLMLNHLSSRFPSFREFLQPVGFPAEYTTRVSLHNEEFTVNLGPNVISFGCLNNYKGWQLFSAVIQENMSQLVKSGLIGDIERIGLRYINFFKNIMLLSQKINLDISFAGREKYNSRSTSLRTELLKGNFNLNIIAADNVVHNNVPGSILDIDVTTTIQLKAAFSNETMKLVEQAHTEEKLIFYSLLKPEFLKTFNPIYQ